MKISVIGAGNVGGLSAMRLAESRAGDIFLIDIAKGLAKGKSLDMDDSRHLLKNHFSITGCEDITEVKGSDIIVLTAGFARKPGMTREELSQKNAQVVKEVSLAVKKLAPAAIFIIVTNPLDLMTKLALGITGFKAQKVFGMGPTLDAARFASLISQELQVPVTDIDSFVIASHGEGMLPLPRFTTIKGAPLTKFLDAQKCDELAKRTVQRGAEIVSLLGSGSAYFAPSAAVADVVRNVAKDEKLVMGACAFLDGEYGLRDICIGVPCRLGRNGVEQIISLELNEPEKKALSLSAESVRKNLLSLKPHFS